MDRVLTRRQLYDLVWQEPMTTLAKKFNISDVGLRKTCIRLNIPLPKGGHWQKIRVGKKVKATELPSPELEEQVSLEEIEREQTKKQYPWSDLQQKIETDPKLPLQVAERLVNPDPLISRAKESLLNKENKSWKFTGMVTTRSGFLNITVQPKNVNRALIFYDAFIKLLRARGHNIEVQHDSTYAIVKGQRIKVQLRELSKIINHPKGHWPEREFMPIDQLAFKTDSYCYHEWKDGNKKLEEQLGNILAKMETAINDLLKVWEENRKREEEQKKILRLKEDLEERKKLEIEKMKQLLNKSIRWEQVKVLRDYIDDAEARASQSGEKTDEFKSWLSWARKKADWFDPYVEAPDELLTDDDRYKIFDVFGRRYPFTNASSIPLT